MNACPKSKHLGFSLVELMMGIMIMAILVSLALPGFRDMLRNAEVRNAAESVAGGLQRARAEAVARNTNVEFVLGVASSWVVRVVSAPNPPIESRSSSEGSNNVTVVALAADLATPATTVTFTNFGGVTANVPVSESLTQVDFTAPGATQNLRVTMGVGGNARMCDPSLAAGSSPRAC